MGTLRINDEDYDIESLSDEAKAQIASIQFVENEIKRLEMSIAALKTARNGYTAALTQLVSEPTLKESDEVQIQDTVSFD